VSLDFARGALSLSKGGAAMPRSRLR